jgi:hypothetical protein
MAPFKDHTYFPDGRTIAAGAADGHVLVFDTEASPAAAK